MSSARSRRLAPEERRRQLVKIGLELLAEYPLDALSTDEVARRAGISRGLLFHYFASKRDYHQAVVRAACTELLDRTAPPPGAGARASLHAMTSGFVDYVREHRQLYLTLVRGASAGDPAVQEVVDETRRELAERVLAFHRHTGHPAPPRLALTARAWTAFAEEAVVSWPTDEPGAREELLDYLESHLLKLIGPAD
ncbi:TetR/AcrR family transcriptional regulator [Streptomyces albireticuli]|uniref:TetR/AcrR family transcriptional regulator n=1 Tax=Streptomyces albireticuli TaxID=1940 RepID=UPI0036ABB616